MSCPVRLVLAPGKAAKLLQQAGFDEPQAEAVVTTVGEALTENVATKADLTEVKTDLGRLEATLRAGIAALGAEVKTDLADLATGLYRQLWVMAAGIVGLTVSLTVSLVKLLL